MKRVKKHNKKQILKSKFYTTDGVAVVSRERNFFTRVDMRKKKPDMYLAQI